MNTIVNEIFNAEAQRRRDAESVNLYFHVFNNLKNSASPRLCASALKKIMLALFCFGACSLRAEQQPGIVFHGSGAAAESLAEAPLLRALGVPRVEMQLEAEPKDKSKWTLQGLNHIVLAGISDEDAVFKKTVGFSFAIDTEKRELYRLGYGRFSGNVGCVETRFNPWLYSNHFDDNPFSTLLVRISGTTEAGVKLAAEAFKNGMNNGVVLGIGAARAESTILDLEPSDESPPNMPAVIEKNGKKLVFAGWTQCPANEYRAMLDLGAKAEPRRIWRVKYLSAESLATASASAWIDGPAAIAPGNALIIAEFGSAEDAQRAHDGAKARAGNSAKAAGEGGGAGFSVPMAGDEQTGGLERRIFYRVVGKYFVGSSLPEWAGEISF